MKTIIVTEAFKFAHRGVEVEEFVASQAPVETTDECADLAVTEGWAKLAKAPKAKKDQKADDQAPDQGQGAEQPTAPDADLVPESAPEGAGTEDQPE